MKSLLLRTAILTVVLFLVGRFLGDSEIQIPIHSSFDWMLVFFFVSSLLIGWMLELAMKDASKFILLALGGTVLRLLVTIFGMVTAVIAGVTDEEVFIITFFVLYLLYMIFELIFVLSNLRPDSTKL